MISDQRCWFLIILVFIDSTFSLWKFQSEETILVPLCICFMVYSASFNRYRCCYTRIQKLVAKILWFFWNIFVRLLARTRVITIQCHFLVWTSSKQYRPSCLGFLKEKFLVDSTLILLFSRSYKWEGVDKQAFKLKFHTTTTTQKWWLGLHLERFLHAHSLC